VPPPLEHLIRTCLAKDPDDRWQSARDVERELSFIADGRATAGVPPPKSKRRRWPLWTMLAGAFAASLVTAWWLQAKWDRTPIAPPAARVRFNVQPPAPATLSTDQMEARVSPTSPCVHRAAAGYDFALGPIVRRVSGARDCRH